MSAQPTIQEHAAFFDDRNEKHRSVGFDEIEPESKARAEASFNSWVRSLRNGPEITS